RYRTVERPVREVTQVPVEGPLDAAIELDTDAVVAVEVHRELAQVFGDLLHVGRGRVVNQGVDRDIAIEVDHPEALVNLEQAEDDERRRNRRVGGTSRPDEPDRQRDNHQSGDG